MSGKLFEVLAVEAAVSKAFEEAVTSYTAKFKNKSELFKGMSRRLSLLVAPQTVEEKTALEAKDSQTVPVQATVAENANYIANQFAELIDVLYQKEEGNTRGKADVVLADGTVLVKDLPVCLLLGLETRLSKFRQVIMEMPTLDSAKIWEPATEQGAFIVKTAPQTSMKTAKDLRYDTMAAATDKHPAQINMVTIEKNVGTYTDISYSGMVSSQEKAALLTRLDDLLKAVVKARMRANDIAAVNDKIGGKFMSFLFGNWFDPSKVNPAPTQATTVRK